MRKWWDDHLGEFGLYRHWSWSSLRRSWFWHDIIAHTLPLRFLWSCERFDAMLERDAPDNRGSQEFPGGRFRT